MKILLSAAEAADLLGISERKFLDLRASEPTFPKARALGPRATRWVRSELEAYAVALPAIDVRDQPPELAAAAKRRAAGKPVAPAPFNGASL